MQQNRVALVTGCTGQDGSYLVELLLSKGYIVHGIVRRSSSFNRGRIEHLYGHEDTETFKLHYGDMTDFASIVHILQKCQPDEIYNLAAQSHVQVSFDNPLYTGQVDALGVLNLLEACRTLSINPKIYQASTSELFSGDPTEAPQNEMTPFRPRSPYGVAKLYAFNICRVYRESYGMFISNGILFNHESERRGENFVTRKITLGIRDILHRKADHISLGNLEAKRDFGYAPEYVEAMWLMLQQNKPDDFVIATGETHSVAEFAEEAFSQRGLDWKRYVKIDDRLKRPNEVWELRGDATKAKHLLDWQPKTTFKQLVAKMVSHDTSMQTRPEWKGDEIREESREKRLDFLQR